MLFTFALQQTIKPISENNKELFNQISKEVEELYLPQYLGGAFAYDVQKNPTATANAKLLAGVEFNDCNNNLIKFLGLNYCFAYLIFAEYSWQTKLKDTYTGFVSKARTEAETLSQGQESQIKSNARKIGEHQVTVMKNYLNEKSIDYPLWNCDRKTKAYTPKFTPIKRTNS